MRVVPFAALFIASSAHVARAAWRNPFLSSNDVQLNLMDSWSYTDCGLPTDVIQLKSIEVSPDPPVPGQELTITAQGTVTRTIDEGAYADVVVKLGLIKLIQKKFDVCEEARQNNASIQCPVEADDYTVVQKVALPKEIPKAKFSIAVRGYTVENEDMLCVDISLDFMRHFLKL